MKKTIVVLADQRHKQLESVTGRFRRLYAARHAWEYLTFFNQGTTPEDTIATGVLESLLQYDLVALMSCNSVINPRAECLSAYEQHIPESGLAAVINEPQLSVVHPLAPLEGGTSAKCNDVDTWICGGVLLFRPKEICSQWSGLVHLNSLTEGAELSVLKMQRESLFGLSLPWSIVWTRHAERHYPFLTRRHDKGMLGAIFNSFGLRSLQRALLILTLYRNQFVHLAADMDAGALLSDLEPENLDEEGRKIIKSYKVYV